MRTGKRKRHSSQQATRRRNEQKRAHASSSYQLFACLSICRSQMFIRIYTYTYNYINTQRLDKSRGIIRRSDTTSSAKSVQRTELARKNPIGTQPHGKYKQTDSNNQRSLWSKKLIFIFVFLLLPSRDSIPRPLIRFSGLFRFISIVFKVKGRKTKFRGHVNSAKNENEIKGQQIIKK
jgi:hypothetical protein